jgi:hypothetical protein
MMNFGAGNDQYLLASLTIVSRVCKFIVKMPESRGYIGYLTVIALR